MAKSTKNLVFLAKCSRT